ncbi:MAG TPA: hypothetical protein HPP66_01455 [Planctomycetes bacterium]|nr:hypothetical protein [Planctomycetota bacterium]
MSKSVVISPPSPAPLEASPAKSSYLTSNGASHDRWPARFLFGLLIGLVLIASLAGSAGAHPYLKGDITGDRKVDFEDLKALAYRWLDASCVAPACEADLDGVPGVSMSDFALLAEDWTEDHSQITLVINEFMADNDSFIQDPNGDHHDWIEIYNYGHYAIDIAGMYLTDDVDDANQWHRIPDNYPDKTTIEAYSYLLIWADRELSEEGLHVDFKLDAAGDEDIGLFDTDGSTLIDSIIDFPAQSPDDSYGRFPNGSGPWCVFLHDTNTTPTPGEHNGGESGINVVINEIMYHPYHRLYNPYYEPEDIRAEYIELFNRGTQLLSLAGWRITDGVDFAFPNDVTIGAGQYLVVAADVNTFKAKYPDVTNVVGGWYGRLSNSGEAIELIDNMRVNVDHVRYADEGEWAVRELGLLDRGHRGWIWSEDTDGDGKSLELVNPALPNEYGQNWAASVDNEGTPGVVNSVADVDTAPLVVDVKHRPIIPGPDEPVTITARIIDELTTGITVTLHYRVDTSVYVNENSYPHHDPGDYIDLTMLDDGMHGDGEADDGVHGVNVPAHPDGKIIEFYIEASDAAANSRTWSAPAVMDGTPEQVTNMLYQVDDSFVQYWTAGDQPIYYIIMTEMERARLRDIVSDSSLEGPNCQMNATFISADGVDTKVRYNVGVRNRGHGTRRHWPNNYRVNFAHDRSWKGVTAINLNSVYTWLQLAGNAMFQISGVAQCEATAVKVKTNGQNLAEYGGNQMYGSYVHAEVVDSDFADNHYPVDDAGNAYKCMRLTHQADLRYEGTNPEPYRSNYFKRTNNAEDDWSDLIGLTYALSDNTPDETYVEEVNRVMNAEQWLRFIAVNVLMNNNETTLANGNGDDYYMYCGIEDPRFVLIQHDLDSVFGLGQSPGSTTSGIFRATTIPTMDRFLKHPQFVSRYYWHLNNLIETTFSAERLNPFLDELLADFVPAGEITKMKNFAAARNSYVLSLIRSEFTAEADLPQASGYYKTNSNTAALYGTADAIDTRSVLVNGRLADWWPIDGQWEISESTGTEGEILCARGSIWKYLDDGSNQGTIADGVNWFAHTNYNDSDWDEGPAELGYGDAAQGRPEATVVNSGPSGNHYITTYFRHLFDVNNASKYSRLSLRILRDDGAVVYLNGVEIARSNMPPSPPVIDYTTRASTNVYGNDADGRDRETLYYGGGIYDNDDDFTNIDASLLQDSFNVLAVELHQYQPSSADISFDLELTAPEPAEGEIPLQPGINRVIVQTYGDSDGTGNELLGGFVDIWYDDGNDVDISGTLAADTTWNAVSGPWHVTGDLTVPFGITLTIQPGTTIYFEPSTKLTINGRLIAEGSENELIRFTRTPGTAGTWNGLQFVNTVQDNRIKYAVVEYGRTINGMIGLDQSNLLLDHVTLDHTDRRRISTLDSSLIVCNSTFTNIFEFGEEPTGDNICEHIWGAAPTTGHFIIENNVFGTITGHNDAIDVDGNTRPAPVIQILNNVFLGGGDDALDIEGDAHIEGNVFTHYHKDEFNTGSGNANIMSAGGGHDYVVVRNVFYGCDHVAQVKSDSFMTFVNNTVADVTVSALYFLRPTSTTDYGRGAYVDGSIFRDTELVFDKFTVSTDLAINRSIVPSEWHDFGEDNIDADPIFVDSNADWRLKSMSPAMGAGPWGLDMGAYVPGGACISGEPYEVTYRTDATLTVGGPGITDYKYCINDANGPWSEERSVDEPIALTGLTDGSSYTVYAIGKNSAGVWQSEYSATASHTWTVDTLHCRLVINEVLARNVEAARHNGTTPDLIELYYEGPTSLDLYDMSISDNPDNPRKFVFGAGTTIDPGEYLVLYADDNPIAPGTHLGFGLDGEGEGVYLYNSPSAGGELLDSVEFGLQIPDLSIGRVGYNGRWTLTQPTFGQANTRQPLGDPAALKINEWLANADCLFNNDFIELYNPRAFPVNLGGLFLTDDPVAEPNKHRLAPLSFVPGAGMAVLIADGDPEDGPTHLDFQLSADQEIVALFDADLNEVDKVIYGPQTSDVSQGRAPDGAETYAFCQPPTPGVSNIDTVVINEAMAHSHDSNSDWIELHNTTDEVINIGGWFLSDNSGSRMKYEIADGTTIDPDKYFVFYEDVNFGNPNDPGCHLPFALSENGEMVCLSSGLDGVLTGYTKIQEFGASQTGVSFGRYLTSTGIYHFVALDHNTPELPNAGPRVGPIVINEIMYNPPSGNQNEEYIELYNTLTLPVTLYRIDKHTPWKFTDGIEYVFSDSSPVTIYGYSYLLVVKDKTAFTARYGGIVPHGVEVLESYDGWLSGAGEKLELSMPGDLNSAGVRQYICIDRVRYYDKAPWPTEPDGYGKSLSRKDPNDYGDDVNNWKAAVPSPGAPNP